MISFDFAFADACMKVNESGGSEVRALELGSKPKNNSYEVGNLLNMESLALLDLCVSIDMSSGLLP